MLKARGLAHGGLMVNYKCTAACRHCLYGCSPTRGSSYGAGDFISADVTEAVCKLLSGQGLHSLHIGGGEPFIDFKGLIDTVKILRLNGLYVEYIETNAFWAKDEKLVMERLEALLIAGANTLCISADPFHAEFVPPGRPLFLAGLCEKAGMRYFLWQEKFLPALSKLNQDKTHSREEIESAISENYIIETAKAYGLSFGGRALMIEEEYFSKKPVGELLDKSPCARLLGGHFHADMLGRFIPPCTGVAIPLSEAINGIPDGKYPALEALYAGGVSALFALARKNGFEPDSDGYTSKCAACFHIRRFLSGISGFPELDAEHYVESMKF